MDILFYSSKNILFLIPSWDDECLFKCLEPTVCTPDSGKESPADTFRRVLEPRRRLCWTVRDCHSVGSLNTDNMSPHSPSHQWEPHHCQHVPTLPVISVRASPLTTCPHTPRHISESLTTVNMSPHSPSQKCEVSGRKLKDNPQSKAGQLDVAVTY